MTSKVNKPGVSVSLETLTPTEPQGRSVPMGVVSGAVWKDTENYLFASDKVAGDWYGSGLDVSDDGLVLATGALYASRGFIANGQAYIYDKVGASWVERNKIQAIDAKDNDYFGNDVSLTSDGAVLVVGASAVDDGAVNNGRVYTYDWTGSAWSLRDRTIPYDGVGGERFGISCDISSDGLVLAVGAFGHNGSRGKVYIYDKSGSTWAYRNGITGTNANDKLGRGVALSPDGSELYITEVGTGKVYWYSWTGSAWSLTQTISPPVIVATVDFSTDLLLLGSGGNDQMVIYRMNGGVWDYDDVYVPDDNVPGDNFGTNVALKYGDSSTVYVSAQQADTYGKVYTINAGTGTFYSESEHLGRNEVAKPITSVSIEVLKPG